MSKVFNLDRHPDDFPEAMAAATRLGFMHALTQKQKIKSVAGVAQAIAPGCAYGYAVPLKQAYNGGYWSGELVNK